MEKVDVLITRLLELYRNKSSVEQLRLTTQLLLSELQKLEEKDQNFQSVSVFFPSSRFSAKNGNEDVSASSAHTETDIMEAEPELKIKSNEEHYHAFDPMMEIPTLALKQQEINETIAAQHESVNDKLKSSHHKDIAHNISDGPIKDLRKAIGINDQYLFINELFRGDQTMYERSIKTINSFNIYAEAELWIKRELKLKLAWQDNSSAAALFDQLVRRRFA